MGGEVAHTYHHRLHLAQGGIAHHGHLVARTVAVVVGEGGGIGSGTLGLGLVAGLLQGSKYGEVDVEHVLFGPYGGALGIGIDLLGRELQRYLIFIIVALVVAAEAHEDGELVVLQVGDILQEGVGVDEHLQTLVLAQVEGSLLVDRLRLAAAEVLHNHAHRLFVALHQLGL